MKPSRERLFQINRSWQVVIDCIGVVNPRAICLSKQDAYTETDARDFPVMDSIEYVIPISFTIGKHECSDWIWIISA